VSSKRLTVIEKLSEIRDLVKSFLPTKVDLESLVKDIRTVVSRQQAIETVLAENDKLKEDLKRVSLRLAAVESQLTKISESRSSSVDVGVSQIHSKLEILDQKLTRLTG
jgi:predicted  nucleic acid-binding Zn-ribbon protein